MRNRRDSPRSRVRFALTVATSMLASTSIGGLAHAEHVWTCPTEIATPPEGYYEFYVELLIGDGGAAHDVLETIALDNSHILSGNWDRGCFEPLGPGRTLTFRIIGQLIDSRLEGRIVVSLSVCSDAPGPTAWATEVRILPHPNPHVWIVPDSVVADDAGEFFFWATLLVGEGGAAHDYSGADELENTEDTSYNADGFCFDFVPAGETIRDPIRGHLIDVTRRGRVRVWLEVCAPAAWDRQAGWSSDVLIKPSVVSTSQITFSSLKTRFRE